MILGGGFFDSKWVVGVLLYNSISYSVVFKFFRMLAKNKTRENWMNGGGHAKWLFEKIKKDIQIEQNWKFLKLLYTYRHRKHTLTFLKPPAELLENNLYLMMIYLPIVSGWKGSLGINAYVEGWKQLMGGTKINFKNLSSPSHLSFNV